MGFEVNRGIGFRWASGVCKGAWRVLKADEGDVPIPGPSERKQKFYSQAQLVFPFMAGEEEVGESPEVNFIVLWDVPPGSYSNLALVLVCPKAGGTTRDSVEIYWGQTLPHPADEMPTPSGGEEAEDLDIKLLDEGKTGEGNDDEQ